MIRKLYKTFIPNYVRHKIYETHIREYQEKEVSRILRIEAEIPEVELREEHIRNLKVLLNRDILLHYLPKYSVAAELGVDRGEFSSRILSIAQPKILHLIDLWSSEEYPETLMHEVEKRFATNIESSQVQIHRGYSYEELEKFQDSYFDWIYIDTDHTYETTRKELDVSKRKVKDEGLILGHDYIGHDYVMGSWNQHYRYGVIESVNEFCLKNNWEMIFLTHETHRHISYAIKRIP